MDALRHWGLDNRLRSQNFHFSQRIQGRCEAQGDKPDLPLLQTHPDADDFGQAGWASGWVEVSDSGWRMIPVSDGEVCAGTTMGLSLWDCQDSGRQQAAGRSTL